MKTLLPLALAALAGCGTIEEAFDGRTDPLPGPGPHVFGGVRLDLRYAGLPVCHGDPWRGCVSCLDLPLSAALDAALLPLTLPLDLTRPKEAKP